MKKNNQKSNNKIFFILQIIFVILTFVFATLVLLNKMANAYPSIICMALSLVFGFINSKFNR